MNRRTTALVFACGVLLAACGSDSGDTTAVNQDAGETPTTQASSPEDLAADVTNQAEQKADDLLANAGEGSFVVDGESFDAPVVRCEPFAAFGEPDPSDLNVRAFASGSVYVEVDVAASEGISMVDGSSFDQQLVTVFLSRPGDGVTEQFEAGMNNDADGNWYTSDDFEQANPLPAPYALDGNTISGSMTVAQTWPQDQTGTAEVSFDLDFPDEIHDCSL